MDHAVRLVRRVERGVDDHARGGVDGLHRGEQAQSVAVGQLTVEHEPVEGDVEQCHGVGHAPRLGHLQSFQLEAEAHQRARLGVVVDDQHVRPLTHGRRVSMPCR